MNLSKKERLSLINQFLILEKLYPEESSYYEKNRIALERGYTLHYEWLFENIWDELSEKDCQDVLDTLDMYRAITYSFNSLEQKNDIIESMIRFPGYDGNNESHHMAYVRYFIVDLERFEELRKNQEYPDFNSHCPMISKYEGMRDLWKSWQKPSQLSTDQITQLLDA